MARRRVRAARRKSFDGEAHEIATYVQAVARDLGDRRYVRHVRLAFPRQLSAPLITMAEMAAVAVCQEKGWGRERADDVATYLLEGVQEALVALVKGIDEDHFERWLAALDRAEARAEGVV